MEDQFNCEFCQDTGIEFEMCCKSVAEAASNLCGCQGEPEALGPCLHCEDDDGIAYNKETANFNDEHALNNNS